MISWLNGSIVVQAPWSFLLSCTVQVSWTHCCPPQAHLPCPAICLAHSAWFCISRASQSLLFLCSMASEVFTDRRIKFKFLSLASKVYDLILIYISRCFLHCPSTCILNAKHHQSQNSLCDLLPGSLITSDFLPRTLSPSCNTLHAQLCQNSFPTRLNLHRSPSQILYLICLYLRLLVVSSQEMLYLLIKLLFFLIPLVEYKVMIYAQRLFVLISLCYHNVWLVIGIQYIL